MVAIIKTGHSIHRIFNYNEIKVKEGAATCIGAQNYPLDVEQLNLSTKLSVLERQLALNTNVSRNSVHISLNFDPSEAAMEQEKLMAIASRYMEGIGFRDQPYLVYRHNDAGHPHIHIVSIKVRPDGKRIDMNNIGRNQSETARKAIENEFNLVRAENQKHQQYSLRPISAEVVKYGKVQSKRAVQNVLDFVIGNYRFASLPELNAVLRQYNVQAERGTEDSRTFQRNGLLYRIIDEKQNPVGVPIKASSFYSKPTLQTLAIKYAENEPKRQPHKQRIKNAIDLLLKHNKLSLGELYTALQKQGIALCFRNSTQGQIYGITYVDHTTRCVFNGSALGKAYSAKGLQERCRTQDISGQDQLGHPAQKETGLQMQTKNAATEAKAISNAEPGSIHGSLGNDLMKVLFDPQTAPDYIPGQLKRNKRRRKKRNRPNNNNNI
jgi:hypothetical protein